MTQHNLTQILKAIRDFVMRNRPCYRDYLGSETETKTVQIGSGTFEDNSGRVMAQFQVTDPAFTGFILEETYAVTIDGITEDYVARNLSPVSEEMGPIIGTITTYNIDDETFDGWICLGGVSPRGEAFVMAQTLDTSFAGKTISISHTRTKTVERYNTKLLPEYLLPAFLRKNVVASKSEVQKAQTTADRARNAADNAQIAANNAQTTANTAKSTASSAQTTANNALPKTGGTISGNLTVDNENDSYRNVISVDKVAVQYVNSAGTATDRIVINGRPGPTIVAADGSDSGFQLSTNGLSLGYTSTSKDGIHLTHSNRSSTPGKIVIKHTNPENSAKEQISIESTGKIICNNSLKFDCGSEIEVVQTYGQTGGSAIILRSSTADSTKRFRITVDDTGSLATESNGVKKTMGMYSKPSDGIPKADLSDAVQASLGKADIIGATGPGHNSIYRGKYLGTSVTEAQWQEIANGTFDDMYIGDYWTIGGVTYRIAAFDYYLGTGDTAMTTHHITLVPDVPMYSHIMSDSDTGTTGGYVGSKMYTTGLAKAKTTINNAFGSDHILTHRQYLCNAVTNGKPSGSSWYDSTVELMTEQNVYGGRVFGTINDNDNSTTLGSFIVDKSQYPLFAFRPDLISNNYSCWLRDVVGDANFACVSSDGCAGFFGFPSFMGVRPAFSIKS